MNDDLQHRILLVDDDAAVLRAHAKTLTFCGWLVESATGGKQAIELLRRGGRSARS